jgi:hypothetical protein
VSPAFNIIKTPLSLLRNGRRVPFLTNAFFFYVIIFLALMARLNSLSYIAESLWYEDGELLINQSYEFGLNSLFLPWGGNQHLYDRVVALLAKQGPLVATPYVFFFAWLYSFFLIVLQIRSRAGLVGLGNLSQLILALTISLQPSHGEAFFNLVHADYYLGIALALYICMPAQAAASALEIGFLVVTSLTGVASVALTPVLALQYVTLRDFSTRKAAYIIVPSCAIIQVSCMVLSERWKYVGIDRHFADWLHGIGNFLAFGSGSYFVYCVAALFWAITSIYLLRSFHIGDGQRTGTLWVAPLSAVLATAVWFLLVVLRGEPLSILSPLDMESRYFLMPYSLIFFIALTCTKDDKRAHVAVGVLLGIICSATFLTVSRPDRESTTGLLAHTNMQWPAFTKFQKIKPNLIIPINSPVPVYPPSPSVQINKQSAAGHVGDDAKAKAILLSAQTRASVEREAVDRNPGGQSPDKDPVFEFDITKYCVQRSYIALEIDVWRERMGSASVHWGRPEEMSDDKSLERFYPAGPATMQFAFRRDLSDSLIEFYPALGVKPSAVVRTFAKAMQDPKIKASPDPAITIAAMTPPGGLVKLKEVRLFCLE